MQSIFRARLRWTCALVVLSSIFVVRQRPALAAAPSPDDRDSAASSDSTSEPGDPSVGIDAGDLWRMVRHKENSDAEQRHATEHPFVTVAPTISSKPSTGLAGGIAGNVAFVDGDPATTHFSTAAAGFRLSEKSQTLGSVRFGIFTSDDRWFVQGDTRLWWTSLNTYSLGPDELAGGAVNLRYNLYRVFETTYYQLGHRVFVGAGLNISDHADIRPGSSTNTTFDGGAFAGYSQTNGFAVVHQTSSGTNASVLLDTRDNPINADRGAFASATYRTFFSGFLGGDSTWQELNLDARTYRSLTRDGRQRIAFWFMGDLVTGGTVPFLDLPSTSSDGRSARGYAEGQFRGPHLLYGEVEYRATLVPSGLLGAVAFVNTTTVDGNGMRLFQAFEPAAGGGLRLLLNKHSRTNLCVDYGWGRQGSHGLYLGIQEAF